MVRFMSYVINYFRTTCWSLSAPEVVEASLVIAPSLPAALSADGQAAVAVLSFKCLNEEPPAHHPVRTHSIEFDVVAVRVPPHAANNSKADHLLDVLWHRRGANAPLYVGYERRRSVFILAGGSPYRPIGHPTISRTKPSPDELAPIPRADDDDYNVSAPAVGSPPNYYRPMRGPKTRKR